MKKYLIALVTVLTLAPVKAEVFFEENYDHEPFFTIGYGSGFSSSSVVSDGDGGGELKVTLKFPSGSKRGGVTRGIPSSGISIFYLQPQDAVNGTFMSVEARLDDSVAEESIPNEIKLGARFAFPGGATEWLFLSPPFDLSKTTKTIVVPITDLMTTVRTTTVKIEDLFNPDDDFVALGPVIVFNSTQNIKVHLDNWMGYSVPEPTSGSLLLGLAGFCFRRRKT